MARDQLVTVTKGSWAEITLADVTNITFQNRATSNESMDIRIMPSATPPAETEFGILYQWGKGEINRALSDLAPGVTGIRVFVKFYFDDGEVWVSHA